MKITNKEISWLSFNARVLQEASDPKVPLLERIKFLGIFSSNLDEFFRVRVATLKRLEKLGKKAISIIGHDPGEVLDQLHETVLAQQDEFENIYQGILRELESEKIFIIDETQLNDEQAKFVESYFKQKVRPALIPIMIDQLSSFPELKDHSIYLAVCLSSQKGSEKEKFALIEVPTDELPRFLILPERGKNKYIILLDDVIRYSLKEIFSMFNFDEAKAYTIKVTRDAELDIDEDFSESFIRKVSKSLAKRKLGTPVRFVYDEHIPDSLLNFFIKQLQLRKADSNLIPGARYHNFKDFINFPRIGAKRLRYEQIVPLTHKVIESRKSLLKTIKKQDILLHYPYQTFDYVIDFLREAAMDPKVTSIKISLYRVAKNSKVVNALINAVKNGKSVTVVMELQARFDEAANIYWSNILRDEGVRVIHGVPGLKVHAKMILVTRQTKKGISLFANLGTGNYNESTAKIYSDHALFTADRRLTREVEKVFEFLEKNYKRETFRHLLVSPFNIRQRLVKLINSEIKNANKGKPAYIIAKLNNLTDPKLIKKLYEAGQVGVKIHLMVRSMFSLIPGEENVSENIDAISIVDKFLEHSRFFVFCNGGENKYYLTSADWMPRNLDNRVEVTFPIYDPSIQQEIKEFINIQWQDNVKARILNPTLDNQYVSSNSRCKFRAQEVLYDYCKAQLNGSRFDLAHNGKLFGEREREEVEKYY